MTDEYDNITHVINSHNLCYTLDGKPAYIRGACEPFATVWQKSNYAHQATFSWPAVNRIVAAGGNFKT